MKRARNHSAETTSRTNLIFSSNCLTHVVNNKWCDQINSITIYNQAIHLYFLQRWCLLWKSMRQQFFIRWCYTHSNSLKSIKRRLGERYNFHINDDGNDVEKHDGWWISAIMLVGSTNFQRNGKQLGQRRTPILNQWKSFNLLNLIIHRTFEFFSLPLVICILVEWEHGMTA